MHKETPSDWAEESTPEKVNGTKRHSPSTNMNEWSNNFYNSLYRKQQVDKQLQDVLLAKYTLEYSSYWIEGKIRWIKRRIWSNFDIVRCVSPDNHAPVGQIQQTRLIKGPPNIITRPEPPLPTLHTDVSTAWTEPMYPMVP